MKRRKPKGLQAIFDQLTPKERKIEDFTLNFLLTCSERSLGEFELRRLAEVANLRKELHAILDKIIDEMAQAGLAAWFRQTDRNTLKHALENPPDVVAWAKAQIKRGGRGEEEQAEDERYPIPAPNAFKAALLPGKAHEKRKGSKGK